MGAQDTRPIESGDPSILLRRRRVCPDCGFRMTTHEVIAGAANNALSMMARVFAHDDAVKALMDALAPMVQDIPKDQLNMIRVGRSRYQSKKD